MLVRHWPLAMRPAPYRSPDDVGGVARDTAPDTAEQVQDAVEDVTDALKEFPAAVRELAGHMQTFVAELARLHPIEAVKQVPEAASELAADAGRAAGDTAAAAGHAVGTVPAAATDVLDTAQTGGREAVRTARRYTLQKRRR